MPPEPAPPPNVDFEGLWENRLGSEMEIEIDGNNVSGIYRTGVGSPDPAEEFELAGWATGDLISFTVNFGKYGSLTSWAGQHTEVDSGEFEIRTMWYLAKNVEDPKEPEWLWSGILSGSNTYYRP